MICVNCKSAGDVNSAGAEREQRGSAADAEHLYDKAAILHSLCEGKQVCVCQHRTGMHWVERKEQE